MAVCAPAGSAFLPAIQTSLIADGRRKRQIGDRKSPGSPAATLGGPGPAHTSMAFKSNNSEGSWCPVRTRGSLLLLGTSGIEGEGSSGKPAICECEYLAFLALLKLLDHLSTHTHPPPQALGLKGPCFWWWRWSLKRLEEAAWKMGNSQGLSPPTVMPGCGTWCYAQR